MFPPCKEEHEHVHYCDSNNLFAAGCLWKPDCPTCIDVMTRSFVYVTFLHANGYHQTIRKFFWIKNMDHLPEFVGDAGPYDEDDEPYEPLPFFCEYPDIPVTNCCFKPQ